VGYSLQIAPSAGFHLLKTRLLSHSPARNTSQIAFLKALIGQIVVVLPNFAASSTGESYLSEMKWPRDKMLDFVSVHVIPQFIPLTDMSGSFSR